MKIGIFGTGMVGQALAAKLQKLEHDVMIGTRDVEAKMADTEPDNYGNPPLSEWIKDHEKVTLGTFEEVAKHGELLINATAGTASIKVLEAAGAKNLADKILIDIANPLDFSEGMPPSLSVCNTDSLGEQIQHKFPNVKVVKTLNTVNAHVMVAPDKVPGDHNLFICGNDITAKEKVVEYLGDWFGWSKDVVLDLGDITSARATEMLLPIWIRLYGKFENPMFNFNIVQGDRPS